ncbi:lipopolysaccharide heptosyltransferase II [Stutzerimonas stutzeri]|uniref:lipopolysaccharide heptosyltransferase II n=1 Tax=Stutzerimonas stutzeri RCH2 TaxID=644801 RepID=L0GEB0_STUST|nr:lipopolysaccharide heptosyltransferase II [Stutzerimonas stutzeri]AGA85058.1 lipopolysaccharide heptosyltransferase II [Stutzerimonas stutzeri RCH2]
MNILIVGPSWVGDMVMAQTLFVCLKQRHPDCQIDVLAPEWSRPILERMPEVRQALSFPVGHGVLDMATRRKVAQSLRGQYQQAILLPNSLKSALVPFFAGIPKRTGWRGEMRFGLLNDMRKLDKQRYPLMIERFMALAFEPGSDLPKPYPNPSLRIDTETRDAALARFGLSLDRPVLALCPGAEFGESKRWPTEHFAKVAEVKVREGWQVWLFGSKNDHPVGEQILERLIPGLREEAVNLAGETSLAEAIDLLSCADAVVSNDSGLMHVSAALGRPLAAVYGSTSPTFTPPLSEQVEVVRLGLDCSPCFERTCRFGHNNCMRELKPRAVIEALDRLVPQSVEVR